MHYIYLHGFASRPLSRKATYFRQQFAERNLTLQVPELDGGNFAALTISSQLAILREATGGEPCILIGSSLGGYLAALYASLQTEVARVVLLAPAFCFPRRWEEALGEEEFLAWKRDGSREFFHYGEGKPMPIGYGLIEDGLQYVDYPDVQQPSLVLHGTMDSVVPLDYAREFARRHPDTATLVDLEADHELASALPEIWQHTERFLFGQD